MIFVICQQKCEINRIFLNVILNILLISLTFFCTFSNNIIVRFDPFSSFPDAFFICSLIIIIIFIDVPPRQILIHPVGDSTPFRKEPSPGLIRAKETAAVAANAD
jgi:hypothetical protein